MGEEDSNGDGGRIDFSDVASGQDAAQPFEFMIPALLLPDHPILLTAKINSETAARVLREMLDVLASPLPPGEGPAEQWERVKTAMFADGEFEEVEREALDLFTEHLRGVSQFAVEIAVGYSLAWALLPVLERAGGNSFRAGVVQSMLHGSFQRLAAHVMRLQSEVERILDERAAQSSEESSNDES